MTAGDTLAQALADVRERLSHAQAEYDRLSAELSKLRLAEKSLASIVEGGPSGDLADSDSAAVGDALARTGRGRGSRGPRANSAKGRLKTLLGEAGPQGLTPAEIARRLPDVAPATLNAYLSTLVTSGEAVRRGDFVTANAPAASPSEPPAGSDEDEEWETDRSDAAE